MLRLSQSIRCKFNSNLLNYANCRHLFSPSILGLDSYIEQREKVKKHAILDFDLFRSKMNDLVQDDSKSKIFTDDLRTICHLAEANNQNDTELLCKMVKKFNAENKEHRFGNYVFGPVVMRYFAYSGQHEEALKLFNDPDMAGFFDQIASYQILSDMLYENKRYKDVLDLYQTIRSRQVQGIVYPRYIIVIVFAACYKENTPESFEFASKLWTELQKTGQYPLRRSTFFAAGLALKQNSPHIALEIVGTVLQRNYVTTRNIKVLALTAMGRADDAIHIFRTSCNYTLSRQTFACDVVESIKDTISKSGDNKLIHDFGEIEKHMKENGLISETTLDELISAEIRPKPDDDQNTSRSNFNNRYNEQSQNQMRRPIRSGLQDLD